MTVIDNADPADPVVFSDPLTSAADAANWNITYGGTGQSVNPADYDVEFGYDITAGGVNGNIPLPPSGATTALRITCNKQSVGQTYPAGVNVYYTNQAFGGNYAVRFNMDLVEGDSLNTVEGVMFGVNHNGLETNWWFGSGLTVDHGPWASDGVWYWIQTPPGGSSGSGFTEYQEYTGATPLPNTGWVQLGTTNAGSYQNVFKHSIFTAPGAIGGIGGGTPANNSPVSGNPMDTNWSDVEIKQVNNLVTLSIDKSVIFTYLNTNVANSHSTNGYLMLGYECPLGGVLGSYIDTPDAAAYFSNLRVVTLGAPTITSITDALTGGSNHVIIQFSSTDGDDTAGSFTLQSTASLKAPITWANAGSVTITQILTNSGAELFQATTSLTNAAQFYRIKHN
jgi:hypothetical protein